MKNILAKTPNAKQTKIDDPFGDNIANFVYLKTVGPPLVQIFRIDIDLKTPFMAPASHG